MDAAENTAENTANNILNLQQDRGSVIKPSFMTHITPREFIRVRITPHIDLKSDING